MDAGPDRCRPRHAAAAPAHPHRLPRSIPSSLPTVERTGLHNFRASPLSYLQEGEIAHNLFRSVLLQLESLMKECGVEWGASGPTLPILLQSVESGFASIVFRYFYQLLDTFEPVKHTVFKTSSLVIVEWRMMEFLNRARPRTRCVPPVPLGLCQCWSLQSQLAHH